MEIQPKTSKYLPALKHPPMTAKERKKALWFTIEFRFQIPGSDHYWIVQQDKNTSKHRWIRNGKGKTIIRYEKPKR